MVNVRRTLRDAFETLRKNVWWWRPFFFASLALVPIAQGFFEPYWIAISFADLVILLLVAHVAKIRWSIPSDALAWNANHPSAAYRVQFCPGCGGEIDQIPSQV
jgi:hypothetical protein